MADDYFDAKLALNIETGNVVAGASAQVYAITDTSFSAPLEITDMSGIPLGALIASPTGIYPQFRVVSGEQKVMAKSGSMVTPLTSDEGSRGPKGDPGDAGDIDTTDSVAGQVLTSQGPDLEPRWQDQAGGSGIAGAPTSWPSAFPPLSHTHGSGQITDATAIGRQVLTATDAQAARVALGAGTGNGTSNLKVGSAATDAAAGNHSHAASQLPFVPDGPITATDVQAAILQAASMGGGSGGGSSQIVVLRYASGQYPSFPATKPAGVVMFSLIGPVTPTTGNVAGGIPAYVGNGAAQIPAEFRVNSGLS